MGQRSEILQLQYNSSKAVYVVEMADVEVVLLYFVTQPYSRLLSSGGNVAWQPNNG